MSAILEQAANSGCQTNLQQTKALIQAGQAFQSLELNAQNELLAAARAGVQSLSLLEPKLFNLIDTNDQLHLYLAEDRAGQHGDVRDIVAQRPAQDWEIGLSAKHNHKALKSPRLSNAATFGRAWLQVDCSQEYKDSVAEIFAPVMLLAGKATWREFGEDNKLLMYAGVLAAFKRELEYQFSIHGAMVPANLLRFLLGNADFYKFMRMGNTIQLQPFNIYGTLGKGIGKQRPLTAVRQLPLPSEFLKISIASGTTMHLYCDKGWQISLRVHNKDSTIQPSLAFDVNLIGQPAELFTLLVPFT